MILTKEQAVMFNTLSYAKMLEEVGFSRDQAETSVKILVEIMEDKLASKQDLKDLAVATKQDAKDLELALRQEMSESRAFLKQGLLDLEHRLTIRMGTMFVAFAGILAALHKLP